MIDKVVEFLQDKPQLERDHSSEGRLGHIRTQLLDGRESRGGPDLLLKATCCGMRHGEITPARGTPYICWFLFSVCLCTARLATRVTTEPPPSLPSSSPGFFPPEIYGITFSRGPRHRKQADSSKVVFLPARCLLPWSFWKLSYST